jgi:hypothetical protein
LPIAGFRRFKHLLIYPETKKELDIGKKSIVTMLDDGNIAYAIDDQKNLYTEFYTKDYTELVLFFESKKRLIMFL